MPMFGGDQPQMMPPGGPQGAPQGQGLPGGMVSPPQGAGVPPGASVQPGPSEMALANQLYSLQQLYIQMQKQLSDLMNRPMQMNVTLHRDNDGKLSGMTATEGAPGRG